MKNKSQYSSFYASDYKLSTFSSTSTQLELYFSFIVFLEILWTELKKIDAKYLFSGIWLLFEGWF